MVLVSVCLPSDAPLQNLPSYLSYSYLGRGVSLHGCSSKVQPLLFNLEERVEVVKQAMARVNINILGISVLKWTGMGEFNSEWHLSACLSLRVSQNVGFVEKNLNNIWSNLWMKTCLLNQ